MTAPPKAVISFMIDPLVKTELDFTGKKKLTNKQTNLVWEHSHRSHAALELVGRWEQDISQSSQSWELSRFIGKEMVLSGFNLRTKETFAT